MNNLAEKNVTIEPNILISEKYRSLNTSLHNLNKKFGVHGSKWAPKVVRIAKSLDTTDVLDYGCGKQYLAKTLLKTAPHLKVRGYDPAFPTLCLPPAPADIVICTDVLEHIEPEYLANVMDDLQRVIKKVGILCVSNIPAKKSLPDGRNAHLIQKPMVWWLPKILKRWNVHILKNDKNKSFWIVVYRKPTQQEIHNSSQNLLKK